jgi:hypothetical protein
MGQEILYCYKCQTRLLGSEFEKGKAFKVGAQASCATCVKDLLGSVPDAAYETDRGRKLASTARMPVPSPDSSSKHKAITNRTLAPPPPVVPVRSKSALVIGAAVALTALVLLGLMLTSTSSPRRPEAPAPGPGASPTPPPVARTPDPPAAAPGGFASELRDIDEKIRNAVTGEECRTTAALLDEARKRRMTPEWLSEIDLRMGQVVGRARRASILIRDKAIESLRRKDDAGVKSLRDQILSWGFPSVVEDFDRALAEASNPAPTPAPAPVPPPAAPAPVPAAADKPFTLYTEAMHSGVRHHSWGGKVDFACTEKAFEGSRSISFAPDRAWSAVYLSVDAPLSVDEYPYVTFAICPTIDTPQIILMLWGRNKDTSTNFELSKLGPPLKAGVWQRFVVPTAPFTPSEGHVAGFILQSGFTPLKTTLYYLDNVAFLRTATDSTGTTPAAAPSPALGKWTAASLKAAARDYDGAQKGLDDAADLELVKLAAQVPAEAAKIVDKWSKGQKVKLEYAGPNGARLVAEGNVVSADPVRVTIAREDGLLDIPVSELAPSMMADLFRSRPDRKPQDARAAAAFCAFEGDVEGMKKFAGENAALPEKYLAFAQSRSALPEGEDAARRTFWAAETEFAAPRRRTAAIEKYTSLQSAPELVRLRPYIAARLESAKDTLFLAEDLVGTGTFTLTGNAKVEMFWMSSADSPPAKAKENYVDAEFYAFPGAPLKAWVWAGGCCQETFEASWQASELTAPNPKNPKEPLSCEPGADASLTLKIPASLRKWHAQHGGPKEPVRWEWIPLPLPKYETTGLRKIRLLTSQQGFAVGAVLVSAIRREPPKEAEMKDLEKLHAFSRKGGGNEPTGSILHEWWWNMDGDNVEDLVKNPAFLGKPGGTALRETFEGPQNMGDRYGARYRGFVHVPVSGPYIFWIASDDGGELFLSSDETPFKKRSIATCPTAGGFRDWTRWPSCKSAPIVLTAGKRYYIEALHKEGGGGDHCSVGWTLPDGTEERPIPGKRLSPWSNASATPVAPASSAPAGMTLYRAIALNSPAATIDGRRWEGKGAPDVSTPEGFENQSVPLLPPVDAAKATMIRSSVFTRGSTWVKLEKVPPGSYQVYLYIWEDNDAQTMDLFAQGKEVLKGYNSGAAGHWDRLGPWPAAVVNGTLEVHSTGGDANFSGLEIWKAGK